MGGEVDVEKTRRFQIKPFMIRHTQKFFSVVLVGLVFLGVGCSVQPIPKSADEIKTATDILLLKPNASVSLKQTVLGLDGSIVSLLGGQIADRHITLLEWKAGDRVALSWTMDTKAETQSSIDARNVYDAKYKDSPIGTDIPPKPDQEFETKIHSGSLSSTSLAAASSIFLPALWLDGDTGEKGDNTLIWISTNQYDELISKRKTVLNLGLFDDSIAGALGLSDSVHNFINSLKQDAATVKDRDELLSVTADQDFGTFSLTVNGKQETVRTIEARNWFGRYTILANRDNPLILEVSLSPASKGSWNIFSKQNFLDAFAGYKVAEIVNP